MSIAHCLIMLIFLSGCVSVPVGEAKKPSSPSSQTASSGLPAEHTKSQLKLLQQQYRQCFINLRIDPELKSIANKVTLESFYEKDPYLELLRNMDVPTMDERSVIRIWAAKLESCHKVKAESYVYLAPDVARLSAAEDSEQQSLVSELYKGNLSYGQFAAKRRGIDSKYRGLILQTEVIDQRSKQSKQPEIQQQQK